MAFANKIRFLSLLLVIRFDALLFTVNSLGFSIGLGSHTSGREEEIR